MRKRYFVISDVEMGKGDVMDDFTDDQRLVDFIRGIPDDKDEETRLILNGDIFDFLKMDYLGEYPRYITEQISEWKIGQIYQHHPTVFQELAVFLKRPNHFVTFIMGNHDIDVIWPKVQAKIMLMLENRDRVSFGFVHEDETLHVEHGHSLDPFFQHDFNKPFEHFRGEKILNLPVGCQVVFRYIVPFKRKFPKEDQFYPRHEVMTRFPDYGRGIKKMQWLNIWEVAYNRFRHFSDPTYRVNALAFFKHVLEFGFDFINDPLFLHSRLRKLPKKYSDKQLFILGHTHAYSDFGDQNKHFLVTDTWRDEFNILTQGQPKKRKTYAEVLSEDGAFTTSAIKFFARGAVMMKN